MNDKWLRSTAYLTYNGAEEYSLGQCINAAQEGSNSTIYAAADAYLNNAGQGGGAAAEAAGGDGSGSGSNVSPESPTTAALSAVTIDGNAAISGTQKTVLYPVGTEFPITKSVSATGNAACNGNFLSIQTADGTEIASAAFANGSATVTHAWAKDTVYKLVIVDENSEVVATTAYTFSVSESNGNGDDGDAE